MSGPAEEKSAPQPPLIPAGGKNLLLNSLSLLTGSVSAKFMSLITVLMLTHAVSVADFGRYSLVFSYWALLNTLVDFGATQLLTREVAKEPANARRHVESVIYLRLITTVLFLPLGYALGVALGLDNPWILLTYYGLLVGLEALYDAYFSGTMNLDLNARARFFSSLIATLLIGAALVLKASLTVIVLIGLSTPLFKFCYDYRYAPFRWSLQMPDWADIRRLAKDGWPLWLMGLQYIAVARIDTFMLQVLSPQGPYDLGIYSAAFRFSEVMSLLLNTLTPAMLPLLVASKEDPERIRFLTSTGGRLILAMLIPLSLLIFWYAPWIVKLYGTGYGESAACMRVLIWSQALVAINGLCYVLLLVYNVQGKRAMVISSTVGMLINIGLNAWLIPQYRALGSSWATVITELLVVGFMLLFIARHTPMRLFRDVALMGLCTLAACVPVLFLGEAFGALSIILFLMMVWGFRLLTPAMVRRLALEKLQTDPTNPT